MNVSKFHPAWYRRATRVVAGLLCIMFSTLYLPAAAQDGAAGPVLTLAEAVRMASENNYDIRIAQNEAQIARNNYTIGNAGFLPVVGITARQNRNPVSGFSTGNGFGSDNNTFDLNAGLNFTLFDGMGRLATYERLGTERSQGALAAEQMAENVMADVVILYYDLVSQQERIEVLQEAVEISEERLRIAELRRDLGSSSELEVRRARVDLNADRASLLRQEVTLSNTKATFNQLLGRAEGLDFAVADTIILDYSLALEDIKVSALRNNRSLRYVEGARDIAELTRREVRSEWLPRIDFQAGYTFNEFGSRIGIPISRPGGFTYGITASMNLFEGFNRDRRLENARLDIVNSELEIRDVQTRLQTEVENAYKSFRNSLQLIDLEEENLNLAQQNVEVALESFRLGTISSIELREVQNALTNIRSRLIAARFEAKRAEIDLLRLGGLLYARMMEE